MKRVRVRSLLVAGLLLMATTSLAAAQDVTISIFPQPSMDGDGVVTSSPAGIDCNLTYPARTGTCSASFPTGTVVTLTATPAPLNTFGQWVSVPGCGASPTCQFTANQNVRAEAYFTPARFPLTISGAGIGYGRVFGNATHTYYGATGLFCEIQAGVASGSCTDQYAVNRPIEIRLENLQGSSYPTLGAPCVNQSRCEAIMPAAPVTIVVTLDAPGFRVLTGGGSGTGKVTGPVKAYPPTSSVTIDCTVSPSGATGTCSDAFASKVQDGPATLTATPSPGSRFAGWSGGCSGTAACVFDGTGATIVDLVSTFELSAATLSVSGSGTGSGSVMSTPSGVSCSVAAGATTGTCAGTFATGTEVALLATPNAGSTFGGWAGGGCSGTGSCSLTMNTAQSVTAQFTAITPTIAVTGVGSGSVSSAPAGIECTIANGTASGACAAPFAYGADLTLTATPASGWTFAGWGGVCTGTGTCKPDLTADRAVTATFVQATVALNVTGTGTGNGVVTSSPGSLSCTLTKGAGSDTGCSTLVPENAAVTLTADPQGGSTFGGWSGDACSGTTPTCALTMSQSRSVVARFTAPRPARDIALTMLGGGSLAADEREQLDRFGNKDGVFNLGDLLALLDRTGEHLTAATTVALVEAEGRSKATPTTPNRRTP